MAITKHDIDNVSLRIVQEGYDPEEVDLLLERIADEVDSFNRTLQEAASRIEEAEARARAAEQQASQSALMAQSSQSSSQMVASERQIAQALIAAQKSADDLHASAKTESENAYREAEKRARDIVRDALSEKQHIIDEIDRLRESTETFRSEYMSMLSRFTSEAQKVMPKLDDYKPDVREEREETAEAMKLIKDADASFGAPAPKSAASGGAGSAEKSSRDAAAQSTKFVVSPAPGQAASAKPVQPAFDLDDDLDIDIEEID